MKQIRQGVFETNSSSTHSVTISNAGDKYWMPKYLPKIEFGEYGWEKRTYTDYTDKLSYVITMISSKYELWRGLSDDSAKEEFLKTQHFLWLKDMVKDYCGLDLEVRFMGDYYPLGYIDHQSENTLDAFWSDNEDEFKSKMKEFIFNEKYAFETDNDNH